MQKILKDQFSHIVVYGHKLTVHHKDQLVDIVRDIVYDFLNYLHCEGYMAVPHKEGHARTWWKNMDGKKYAEHDLFYNYLIKRKKELLNRK